MLLTLGVFVALASSVVAQNFSLVGFGAGTTGGGSAASTTVTSCSALVSAVAASGAKVVTLTSTLSGCGIIDISSNKTVIGSGSSAGLTGGGFRIKSASNVIIRNLNFGPPPSGEDTISLNKATQVWIDHNYIHTVGLTGDKDDYDGQLDITHASDLVTVSWNKFADHWKASLVGHSDSNESEDTGHLRVTYHHNIWSNINSRTPSLRFGTGHVYNSLFTGVPTSGINSRMGAQVLVENNIFTNVVLAMVTDLDSDEPGYLTSTGNVLNNSTTRITQTASWKPSYSYTLDSTSALEAQLNSYVGPGKI
ncbi:pectin lyase fold/virulence factor [Auriculariales sp. MPI-PUGE-AT-0066]|nr:pectin lyase fold/virulence factor [Auriculariales sp. MPI-PUGE-AT-0066]